MQLNIVLTNTESQLQKEAPQWLQQVQIPYIVFLAHLSEPMHYKNHTHLKKLLNWMFEFIRSSSSDLAILSKLKVEELKLYHKKNLEQFGHPNQIIIYFKELMRNYNKKFMEQSDIFKKQYPEYEAVLEYYSLDTSTPTYQENCQKAQKLLKRFSDNLVNAKKSKRPQRQPWTRYQYLTYVALLQARNQSQNIQLSDLEYLIQYSFGGNSKLFFSEYNLKLAKNKKSWQDLAEIWSFTIGDIVHQKQKLQEFFHEKQQYEQQNFFVSRFDNLLAQKKTTKLSNSLKIQFDAFTIVSNALQSFIFSKFDGNYQSNQKNQNYFTYTVYLRARFKVDEHQKQQLMLFRQNLQKMGFIDNVECSGQIKNKKDLIQVKQQNIDEMSVTEQKSSMKIHEEKVENKNKRIFQRDFNSTEVNQADSDLIKAENNEQNVDCEPIKLQESYAENEMEKIQEENYFESKNYFCEYEKNQKSFQSTQASFQLDNVLGKQHLHKERYQNNQLQQISQEEDIGYSQSVRDLGSNEEQNNDQNIGEGNYGDFGEDNYRDIGEENKGVQIFLIQQFVSNLVSNEEYEQIQVAFKRRIQQIKLISKIRGEEKGSRKQNSKQKKQKWNILQNLKFVSFLICVKIAFGPNGFQKHTFRVAEQFVPTKTYIQCVEHYNFYKRKTSNIDQLICLIIQMFSLPLQSIFKEVTKQKMIFYSSKKQRIFKFEGDPTFERKRQHIHKSSEVLLIEKLQRNQFDINLKSAYLVSDPNDEIQTDPNQEALEASLTQAEKERYVKCLENFYGLQKQRLKIQIVRGFAKEIFIDRKVRKKQDLLQSFHHLMMKKHKRNGRQIMEFLKEKKTQFKDNQKSLIQHRNSLRFAKYLFEQVMQDLSEPQFEVQMKITVRQDIQVQAKKREKHLLEAKKRKKQMLVKPQQKAVEAEDCIIEKKDDLKVKMEQQQQNGIGIQFFCPSLVDEQN